jgi:hypothetical protein
LLPVRKSVIVGDNKLCVQNVNEVNDDFVVDGDDDNFVAFEDNHPNVPVDQDLMQKTNVKLITLSLIPMGKCRSCDQTLSVLSVFLGRRRSKLSYCCS